MLNWPCACSCNDAHVRTRARTHTYPEPSRVPAHLISFPSQRGEKPGVTNAPVPAEASSHSQSVCCFQTSWMSARIPFSPSLTHSPAHSLTYPLIFSLPFFFPFLLLTLSPALLSDLSFFSPLVQCLHNAHQLFRGSLLVSPVYPIRAGLCTNGLPLYLLPAPTHSGGGRRIDRGSRGDS